VELEAGHPRRWAMAEPAVFAATEAACDTLAGAIVRP